ncbi:thioredoxin [bacterium BMS3Bbin12]|nr:thioredoxin [bacterium BMS3Abin12]GBE46974.1 thioredoxin [bacterium BMS3Bbin12]GBE50310.1 thioredoxin [bacterium BMS3Bbin13]
MRVPCDPGMARSAVSDPSRLPSSTGSAGLACALLRSQKTKCILEADDVSENIVYVTDDSFENEVLKSGTPVLVDYWAEWCGPCKMIAPILDEIAGEYAGRVRIAKLNIDENPATPPKYGIRGIPTLMLFKNGNVEATKVGAVSRAQLAAFLDSNL